MELVGGPYLRDWVDGMGLGDADEFRRLVGLLLWDARRLDEAGLDHGEMVRLRRHVVVSGGRPVIIDFESASTERRPANVTTVVQSIYLNVSVSKRIAGYVEMPDRGELMEALRAYKAESSEDAFLRLRGVLRLGP